MSWVLVDEDWAAASPFTLGGTAALSGGKLILDGDPAADSYANYDIANADEPRSGSAGGMAIWFTIAAFETLSTPSGGAPTIFLLGGVSASSRLQLSTARTIVWGQGESAALSTSTQYRLDGIYTEGPAAFGGRVRLWIDGSLAFDAREVGAPTVAVQELDSVLYGTLGGAGKITYNMRLGATKIWLGRDPT